MERVNDKNSLAVPDTVLSAAMNNLYNNWFRRWRSKIDNMTDEDFDAMMTEATAMIDEHEQYPLIRNLVVSFVYELDARMHGGGYTKFSAAKLAKLITEAVA